MANRAHEYDFVPVRARKADGSQTTIGMKLLELLELRRSYPDKKERVTAVNKASAEFDALYPLAPRTRTMSRSGYVRKVLLARDLTDL